MISVGGQEAHPPQLHGVVQRGNQPARGNFSANPVDLTVLMWNVRGINSEKKQRYLNKLISEQKPDVAMFNETKLTSYLYLDGYHSHCTLLKRSGGCITFTNLRKHRKVKALGTYLNWTKVLLGRSTPAKPLPGTWVGGVCR